MKTAQELFDIRTIYDEAVAEASVLGQAILAQWPEAEIGIAKLVEVRTSPTAERIAAINDFVEAGYEVHLNFSPVIVYAGWTQGWNVLF